MIDYKNKIIRLETVRKNIDTFLSTELVQLVEMENDYKCNPKRSMFSLIEKEIQSLKETLIE